jgi:hypothetical protein
LRGGCIIFFFVGFLQATGAVPETADIVNNIIEMAGVDDQNSEVDEDATTPEQPAPTHAELYAAMNVVRSYSEKHQLAIAPWRQIMMEAESSRTTSQLDIRTFFSNQSAASASSIKAPRFPSSIARIHDAAPSTGWGVGVGAGLVTKKTDQHEEQDDLNSMERNEQNEVIVERELHEYGHEEDQDDDPTESEREKENHEGEQDEFEETTESQREKDDQKDVIDPDTQMSIENTSDSPLSSSSYAVSSASDFLLHSSSSSSSCTSSLNSVEADSSHNDINEDKQCQIHHHPLHHVHFPFRWLLLPGLLVLSHPQSHHLLPLDPQQTENCCLIPYLPSTLLRIRRKEKERSFNHQTMRNQHTLSHQLHFFAF